MKQDSSGKQSPIINLVTVRNIDHYTFLGGWKLLRNHSYYHQVQVQLNVCNVKYGDFVVWAESGIAIERIMQDRDFYESGAAKVEFFKIYGVLPEIIGKWYTRKHVVDEDGIVRIPTVTEKDSSSSMEEDPENVCAMWAT